MITKIIHVILDNIFPPVCGICGKIQQQYLCQKCFLKLMALAENKTIDNWETEMHFYQLLYIFKYEGMIRKIMLEYKFHEKPYLYETFVKFILKDQNIVEKLQSYDTIIPVPISKKRMKERGYNQSLLIAKALGKYLHINVETNCLLKTKHVTAQSKLNKEERK